MTMPTKEISKIIDQSLKEDQTRADITSQALIQKNQKSHAVIIVKEDSILCGLEIARMVFKKLDKNIQFSPQFKDGNRIRKGAKIAILKGNTLKILAGERVALNFLGHLSGIATKTRKYVDLIKPYKAKIYDTRKTTPMLRSLQKHAVKCAGGYNHRFNLNDQVLIKDNHLLSLKKANPLGDIVKKVRRKTRKKLEIEVDNLNQFKEVLKGNPDIILLDNMNTAQLKKAVQYRKASKRLKRVQLEASGGVNQKTIRSIAQTGVDRISIGELTHSVKNIDFTLELLNSIERKPV